MCIVKRPAVASNIGRYINPIYYYYYCYCYNYITLHMVRVMDYTYYCEQVLLLNLTPLEWYNDSNPRAEKLG